MHGEDARNGHSLPPADGSPPCARGRPVLPRSIGVVDRFTPVCTGKTTASAAGTPVASVHPRVHGEDERLVRVRRLLGRFTPVCTGKTSTSTKSTTGVPVHPRVHGEDPPIVPVSSSRRGSPPCARGRLRRGGLQWHLGTVHPRVHGEDDDRRDGLERGSGSPPCARGRHWKATSFSWFLPAKAPRSLRTLPAPRRGT